MHDVDGFVCFVHSSVLREFSSAWLGHCYIPRGAGKGGKNYFSGVPKWHKKTSETGDQHNEYILNRDGHDQIFFDYQRSYLGQDYNAYIDSTR
jgi:hypothetical protein